jgi:hypothetical protein
MNDRVALALEAFNQLRRGKAYRGLPTSERQALDDHIGRISRTLTGQSLAVPADPYARLLGTPDDLQMQLNAGAPGGGGAPAPQAASGSQPPAPPPPAPAPPPPPSTSQIGQRAADALDAVDFPGFVAALVTGTFKAIVDASKQQISEYAKLVASISQTVESFSQDNVTPNQTRDWLTNRHGKDLQVVLPAPGKEKDEQPKLLPRPESEGSSPPWLDEYGLGGQQLTADLTDGPLVDAGRNKVGEERLQTLATLVLMGINRVVVNDGEITARLQFHASARDTVKADIEQQGLAIAAQQVQATQATSMMVSTVKVNAQADASIKADLMGEVHITFRSETFPLERFADSPAIQLINRHAKWQKETPPAAGAPADGADNKSKGGATGASGAAATPPPPARAPASGGTG